LRFWKIGRLEDWKQGSREIISASVHSPCLRNAGFRIVEHDQNLSGKLLEEILSRQEG
jgi:hypothetical protein